MTDPMPLKRQSSFIGDKGKKLEETVESYILKLKRRQISGAYQVAHHTAELMRAVVSLATFDEVGTLISIIHQLGQKLQDAQPLEFSVGNIVRRVLFIVREEARKIALAREQQQHKHSAVSPPIPLTPPTKLHTPPLDENKQEQQEDDENEEETDGRRKLTTSQSGLISLSIQPEDGLLHLRTDSRASRGELKGEIIGVIKDLIDEISAVHTDIREQTKATEHIHSNEVIMVYGVSSTVREFLVAANKRCKFEVIVAEAAPICGGHEMATQLARSGIATTLIADSEVFAIMARVSKVIVGVHAVMANGGVVGQAGLHPIAIAAHAHSVPLVVCTGMFKLTPIYPNDRDLLASLQIPSSLIPFNEMKNSDLVDIINPGFDYVPPELVSLFITNLGSHTPSFIYRLLADYYDPEDYSL